LWAFGQPIVLLPRDLLARLAPEQIEGILTHELAHLARRDHWTRRLEFVVQATHWWNPIAWAACDQVREAEEACCDAMVARAFPASGKQYGRALLESLSFLSDGVYVPLMASGLTGANSIKRRLVMILNERTSERLGWRGRLSVAVMSLCLLVGSVALTAAPPVEQPQSADDQKTAAEANEDPDAAQYLWLANSFAAGNLIRDPRRLADRHDLNSLMLAGPRITDADLESLARSPQLVELGLIDAGVKGPGLQQLKGLEKLETLVLAGPSVTDAWIEQLPNLAGLKTLRLWGAGITNQGLASLARFHNLETLSLQGVRIGGEGLEVLRQLPKLKSLSLKHTRVDDRDLEALADLPDLEHLSLASPNVKGPGLAHILSAKNLRELQFVGKGVTDAWMREVEPLRNVEWIELHSTSVTGDGLAAIKGWSKLKSAYLNQNPIDDRAIPHLSGLYRLNQLELNDTAMTQGGISQLSEALPDTGIGFRVPEEKASPYGGSRAN